MIFIFHIKPQSCFQKSIIVGFYNIRILKVHEQCQKHNSMIVLLKTNNLSLYLNHEHLKSVLPTNISSKSNKN